MSSDVMPRGTVKTFFVELGGLFDALIVGGIVKAIESSVKYLYQKIRHRSKKPKVVDASVRFTAGAPRVSVSAQVVDADGNVVSS
ncbi:MAG: hypothetical protein OXM01_07245 [Gemmatimonadota bacterium]|nr:hypothetical protein [Gemmatimonadota bacterium]